MDNNMNDVNGNGQTEELTTPVRPMTDVTQIVPQAEDISHFFQQPDDNTGSFEQQLNQSMNYMDQTVTEIKDQNITGKSGKVKKTKSKGKIAAIVGGCTALVAALVCVFIFVIYPKVFGCKEPKKVVADAGEKTAKEFVEKLSSNGILDEEFGLSEIYDKLLVSGGNMVFAISLDNMSTSDIPQFGISADSGYDPVNKRTDAKIKLLGDNDELMTLELIGDEESTYIRIPELIRDYIKIPNKDVLGALKSSYFGMYLKEIDLPEINLDYFPEISEDSDIKISKEIVNAVEELWDNVEVEKAGKEKINILNENINAEKYIVTLKAENVQKALEYVIDYIFNTLGGNSTLQDTLVIGEISYYKDYIKQYLPMLISKDVKFDFYIYDDEIVRISLKDSISILSKTLNYNIELSQYKNSIGATVSLESGGKEIGIYANVSDFATAPSGEVRINLDKEGLLYQFNTDVNDDGNQYTSTYTGKLGIGSKESLSINAVTSYTKTDGVLSVDCNLVSNYGDKATFRLDGVVTNAKKDVSFLLEDAKWALIVDGESVSGSLSCGIDTSNVSVSDIDNSVKTYDLANLDFKNAQKIITDNMSQIMVWMQKIKNSSLYQFIENDDGELSDFLDD